MVRVRRGLYRLVHFPARDHEDLTVVWLWSEQEGVFSHQTALSLHDLSDGLPSKVHLTLPGAWRKRRLRVPDGVVIHYGDVAEGERRWFGPVPATAQLRTLEDCAAEHLPPELLRGAALDAIDRRLVARDGLAGDILARLDAAARRDLGDFIVFDIRPHDRHPEIQNDGMQYDGVRFRAECSLAGKVYARPFGVDVAFGDPMLGEPEVLVADDALAFAGIAPPTLRVYPVETHVAEKLHAYTMPRARPNSRVKDLPDLALIATAGPVEAGRLRAAIDQTFDFRGTHAVPGSLTAPPDT